jgi:hypothetical protein
LVEQGPHCEDRPPGGGIEDIGVAGFGGPGVDFLAEKAFQLGKEFRE